MQTTPGQIGPIQQIAVEILLHYWFYAHNGVNTRAKKGSNGAMNP
jgi:hypothetical protein